MLQFWRAAVCKYYVPLYVGAVLVVGSIGMASALGYATLPRWTGLNWGPAAATTTLLAGVWACAFVALGGTVVYPLAGLFGYLLLAYSVQGDVAAYQILYNFGVLHWAMALALAGGVLARARHGGSGWFPRDPLALAVAAFLAWIAICYVVAEFAGRDAPPRWNREPVYFLHCLGAFWLSATFLRSRAQMLALVGLIAAVLCFRWASTPGFIYNESYIASYLAVVFPLLVASVRSSESRVSGFLFALAALAVVAMVLNIQNRAAVLGVIIGTLAYLLISLSRIRATILSVLFAGLVVAGLPQTPVWDRFEGVLLHGISAGEGRLALWQGGFEIARAYPVFGVGPGQFSPTVPQYATGISQRGQLDAHNSFVEVLAETGVPGLALFCWMLIVALGYAYQVASSVTGQPWIRHAARGLVASYCAYVTVSVFNSRHDMTLLYVLFGATCFMRARWLDRRPAAGGVDGAR